MSTRQQKRKLAGKADQPITDSADAKPSNRKKQKKADTDVAKGDSAVLSKTVDTNSNAKTCKTTTPSKPVLTSNAGNKRLDFAFYNISCEELAKALLGQTLVRILPTGERLTAKIVETEAYLGVEDKAAHSYKGKNTEKTKAMFMPPGTAYVYYIYGSYCCMNVSSQGEGAAVLLRGVEPLEGVERMKKHRSVASKVKKELKLKELGNGPSKICQALSIVKADVNGEDLTTCDHIWLEPGDPIEDKDLIKSKRININYAEEWKDKILRFYVRGNESVSVKDKIAEEEVGK